MTTFLCVLTIYKYMASAVSVPEPTKQIYVYLYPEMNYKWYKPLIPVVFIIAITISMYFIGKATQARSPCDGELAPLYSLMYGWTNTDYVKKCIKDGFTTMESNGPVSITSISNGAIDLLQQFSTRISLAMKTIKQN